MTRRALAAAAVAMTLAAVGCNKGSVGPSLRLAQPSAVAVFLGYSSKHTDNGQPLLHPYAAVANSAQDELVLFDPVDDSAVSAPVIMRPLSIPLPTPRPAMVVSAPFTKPSPDAPERPDLLVAVAAASSELQLIRTWRSPEVNGVAVDPQPGLADFPPGTNVAVDLGGEVVALVATPAVDGTTHQVRPDAVNVIAALADGRLAVVEYDWHGDPGSPETGSGNTLSNAVTPATPTPTVWAPPFAPLSLAVDPSIQVESLSAEPVPPARPPLRNPRYLYAATQDLVGGVHGVAEIDMAGPPPWNGVRGLDAGTPTLLVAAYSPWERVPGVAGAYDQLTKLGLGAGDQSAFQMLAADGTTPLPPVRRVYAYRDPAWCGPTTGEACGIVVLDPVAGGIIANPWHPGEQLPPIAVPGQPVALVAGPPAWNPPTDLYSESDPITTAGYHHRFMAISTSVALRLTTGVLLIPSENGRSYVADLSRWEIPSNGYELNQAGSMVAVTSYRQSQTDLPQIGFYIPRNVADADATNGATPRLTWDPAIGARDYFQLTPGFTPDDVWTLTYQGYLPAFSANRTAQVDTTAVPAGQLRVAIQASPTSAVVNVFDPALGVRVGDIVELWTWPGTSSSPSATPSCPDTTKNNASGDQIAPIEGKITSVDAPDAQHPGGSLVIQRGECVPIAEIGVTECNSATHGPWLDAPDCWDQLAKTTQQVRIRAAGGGDPSTTDLVGRDFVLVGTGTGYAGRVTSIAPPASPQPPAFRFSNDDERAVTCTLDLTSQASMDACGPDCRLACERVAVARRARRIRLTSVYCYKAPTESVDSRNRCETYFPAFADPTKQVPAGSSAVPTLPPVGTFDGTPPDGPALAFSLGVQQPVTAVEPLQLVRDTQVFFGTQSGYAPLSRYGGGGNGGPATSPRGATYFDRSYWDTSQASERYRFYVPHVGNLILDTTPAQSNGSTHVMR